jgi:hypothetical protein
LTAVASTPFFGPTLEESKAQLFRLLGYKLYGDPVRRFHLSAARHRIVTAPARTSKSYAAYPEAVHDFFPRLVRNNTGEGPAFYAERAETIVWLVGVDYSMVKEWDYAYSALIDKKLIEKFGGVIEQSYNSPNQGNLMIRVRWPLTAADGTPARSVIQVKSASNEKTLQGEQVFLAIVSEAAEHTPDLLPKYLDTRCRSIIYPTTPKRKARWLYELMMKGRTAPELDVEDFRFTRDCNPAYDLKAYETAKARARLTFGAPENDPGFMEQFEGEWTFEGGKVIPFRWIADGRGETNVIPRLPSWIHGATWYVSIDYGFNDPCAVGFWACDPGSDDIVLASEIYQRGLVPDDVVEWALRRVADLGIRVRQWIPDPQEPLLTEILRRKGLPLYHTHAPGYLRDRAAGYGELRDALAVNPKTLRPRMQIHASCENTIREMSDVRFKEGVRDEFAEGAVVGADNAIDMARYFLRSRVRAEARESDWLRDFQRQNRERIAHERRMRAAPRGVLAGRSPGLVAVA